VGIYGLSGFEGECMLKIAVIFVLLLLAFLATKYLDENAQKKMLIGLGVVIGCAVAFFMAIELFR
jgi:uncharacterized membrane protein YccC